MPHLRPVQGVPGGEQGSTASQAPEGLALRVGGSGLAATPEFTALSLMVTLLCRWWDLKPSPDRLEPQAMLLRVQLLFGCFRITLPSSPSFFMCRGRGMGWPLGSCTELTGM